jgi:hypothetical protein
VNYVGFDWTVIVFAVVALAVVAVAASLARRWFRRR